MQDRKRYIISIRAYLSNRWKRRSMSGVTLIEILVVVAVNGLVVIPLMAWAVLSMEQQTESRSRNIDTESMGLANTYFPRDVRNATLGAVDAYVSPGNQLPDCTGDIEGGGEAGTVKAVMLTAGNRLIVYKLTAAPPTASSGVGEVMWRRECNNNIATSYPVGSGVPNGIGGTTVLSEHLVSERIGNLVASCPSPTAGSGGTAVDESCWSMKLTAKLIGRTGKVSLQASRRINTLAAPGSPPIARFSYFPSAVSSCSGLYLDGSRSSDPFDEGITNYSWKISKVVNDGGGNSHLEDFLSQSGSASVWAIAAAQLPDKGQYQVQLTVTAGSAATPQGERTGFVIQSLSAGDCVPATAITSLVENRPGATTYNWPGTTSTPIVNLGQSITVTGTVASIDATGSNLSYEWSWGEEDGSGNPKAVGAALISCPGGSDPVKGPCTVTATLAAGYESLGVKRLTLTVIDAQGRRATAQRAVYVVSNVYYASATGSDSSACGVISNPCKSVSQTLANAKTNGKSVVRVAAGRLGESTTFQYTQNQLNIDSPVSIDGGYVISSDGSFVERPTGDSRRPNISDNGTGTVFVIDGAAVSLKSLHIQAQDVPSGASTTAPSSYGVRAIGGANVTIAGSYVRSGQGGNGAQGVTGGISSGGCGSNNGGNYNSKNASEESDNFGGAACSTSPGVMKPGYGGYGGRGSTSNCSGGRPGQAGGRAGDPSNGAAGGAYNGCAWNGSPGGGGGSGGSSGPAGSAVAAASANPSVLAAAVYVGNNGLEGNKGGDGGGGGGGAGGGATWSSTWGGGGGSGGGGGIGGPGGKGGTYGGGSFAVYAFNSTVTITSSTLIAGTGGDGGKGGIGGTGGGGGNGGTGGSANSNLQAGAGGGGGGGAAGRGGNGGNGGPGGPSVVVFNKGSGSVVFSGANTLTPGTGGTKGGGGGPGTGGLGGSGGTGGKGSGSSRHGKNGGDGESYAQGASGTAGQGGLSLRVWDNGTTTP